MHSSCILISVYFQNSISELSLAIDSVINADWTRSNYTILVYVDGPISAKFDSYLKSIPNCQITYGNENRGLSFGLHHLTSNNKMYDFYFRMDSDDISLPDRFIKQIKFLECNPHINVLGGSIVEFRNADYKSGFQRTYPLEHGQILDSFHKGSQIAHVTACFRNSFFRNVNYNPFNKINEDLELWYDSIKAGIIFSNLPDILVYVRTSPSFFKRRGLKKAINEFLFMVKITHITNSGFKSYMFPLCRLIFRLLPTQLTSLLYKCKIRNSLLIKK